MKIVSLVYKHGWSGPLPAELDSPATLILVFGAPGFAADAAPLAALRAAFPQAVLAGCSTAGEIHAGAVEDGTLSVAVIRFERSHLRRVLTPLAGAADSFDAGTRLARDLIAPDLRAVFVLSEGLAVNGALLVDGFNAVLPPEVALSGGLAGDGDRFGSTWVLDDVQPRAGQVCAIGLYGAALQVGLGSGGGWADFGPMRQITRSAGQVLYELDGQPALDLYKSYLGELANGLPGTALRYPLAVRRHADDDEVLVRTILGIDEDQHSLTFAGDLPADGSARLMRSNHARLVDGAVAAAEEAISQIDPAVTDQPALMLSVSCVGRRMVLGEQTDEELESIVASWPGPAVNLGFYSYGEIARAGGQCSRLHNQTMTLTVLVEDLRD